MVSVALAELASEFDAPIDKLQFVSTVCLLAMVIVILPMGWLVGRWGAKLRRGCLRTASSSPVRRFAAWSVESLAAARIVQGLGGGLILLLVQSILAEAAGPRRFGRAMALVAIPGQLAPILGPVRRRSIVPNSCFFRPALHASAEVRKKKG